MNISRIINDVALLLGLCPGSIPDGTPSLFPTLADRISAEIDDLAAQAVMAVPRERLTGWRLLPGDGLRIHPDGSATLPLPSDFLMLFNLRMSDWEREVCEILPHDHWLSRLQKSRWHGLRGTPSRPLAFGYPAEGGGKTLRLYSTTPGATLAEGWYLPAPKTDAAGEIEIPPAAYRRLIESLRDKLECT